MPGGAAEAGEPAWVVELFVRGQTGASNAAVQLVRDVCEAQLPGLYKLLVIDVHQQPERVAMAGIHATPTMVRRRPEPVRRTVGHLTEPRVLEGLGVGGTR